MAINERIIATPNPNFSLTTQGVRFENGLARCGLAEARELTKNHGYEDVTEIMAANPDIHDGLALKAARDNNTLTLPGGSPSAPAKKAPKKRGAKKKAAKKKAPRRRRS